MEPPRNTSIIDCRGERTLAARWLRLLLLLDGTFPSQVKQDLKRVADDVLSIVQQRCGPLPRGGCKPIICTLGSAPIVDAWTWFYRIRLSVSDRDFCRFAYQLGHELGHIFMEPRRTNGLVETLATVLSLQVLDDLATRWSSLPPYPQWQDFAPVFTQYRQSTEQDHLRAFPSQVQAAVQQANWPAVFLYLRYRRADQDACFDERDLNHLGAMALRAKLSVPFPFCDLVGIAALTDPAPVVEQSYRNDLPLDHTLFPRTLHPFLQRLGRLCHSDFGAAGFKTRPQVAEGFLFEEADQWIWLVSEEALQRSWQQGLCQPSLLWFKQEQAQESNG